MALASSSNKSLTTKQIAGAMRVPRSYLSKVLQALVHAGLVESKRGLTGGFALARKPEDLTLLEILNAVNPFERIESCPLDLNTHGSELCPLHRRLDQAMDLVQTALEKTTLAELLSEENPCSTLQAQLATLDSYMS
ncbi:MAG: Rrf2 family transcriptional regulator [Gemmatimonadales bacterium]|nr:Rrf2 family transcriptional regulator [Gemmatimonadales bacterium]